MKNQKQLIYLTLFFALFSFCATEKKETNTSSKKTKKIQEDSTSLLTYIVNPKLQKLQYFSKDESGKPFVNHKNLKTNLEKQGTKLVFAMNGGMYNKDFSPQGLYIENGKLIASVDTQKNGYGNFYLQPNGIFYLDANNKAFVCKTTDFEMTKEVKYATQSGPMLLVDGAIHPKFREGSANLHIRNGVGVLPDGNLLFAMSKEKINFFDLATFFKKQGCENALYLDGFVSRTYLPSRNWEQLDGKYGVIIAEVEK